MESDGRGVNFRNFFSFTLRYFFINFDFQAFSCFDNLAKITKAKNELNTITIVSK